MAKKQAKYIVDIFFFHKVPQTWECDINILSGEGVEMPCHTMPLSLTP